MFGRKKVTTGKDKISTAVASITKLVTDLEEGITQVNAERVAKELSLKEQQEAWALTQATIKNEIDLLNMSAVTGDKLKNNIANLLK